MYNAEKCVMEEILEKSISSIVKLIKKNSNPKGVQKPSQKVSLLHDNDQIEIKYLIHEHFQYYIQEHSMFQIEMWIQNFK